ncbi:MAG: hypothetical protein NC184_04260 [Roseburia sp.]|nr:hypothetical protein [Roseburia sp.]
MTVRQIAISAAALLQADDIEAALAAADEETTETGETGENANGGTASQISAIDDADVRTLIKCVNLAAAELCLDGFPICRTREFTVTDGVIPLAAFAEQPSSVRSVKRYGVSVRYMFDSLGLKVPANGAYTVKYTVVPSDKNLDDDVETGAAADECILLFLVCRDYCLITGRTDEAQIWDQRYGAESEKKRLSRRAQMGARAWI